MWHHFDQEFTDHMLAPLICSCFDFHLHNTIFLPSDATAAICFIAHFCAAAIWGWYLFLWDINDSWIRHAWAYLYIPYIPYRPSTAHALYSFLRTGNTDHVYHPQYSNYIVHCSYPQLPCTSTHPALPTTLPSTTLLCTQLTNTKHIRMCKWQAAKWYKM